MALADLNRSPRCQHVHYSGRPCKAPARRGRNYCVFHHAAHLDAGGCVLPIIEDLHSYQLAIIRIARALADDLIDSRKATALLYAMQLAGSKIEAFAKQRAEVENPVVALKQEIRERYDARRNLLPSWIPETDLVAILKDMAKEQSATPGDHLEILSQPLAADRSTGVSPVTPPVAPCALNLAPNPELAERPSENSPALQRRENIRQNPPSAVGTTETQSSDSTVPTGLSPDKTPSIHPKHVVPADHRRVERSEARAAASGHEPCAMSPLPERTDVRPPQDDIGLSAQGAA